MIYMLTFDEAKEKLLDIVGADFEISFKRNDKGIITLSFIDEDTREKVSFKYNKKTNTTTIAPREMEKDTFIYCLKDSLINIKEVLQKL